LFSLISAQSDYFATDTSTTVGVSLIDGGKIQNSSLCQLKIKKKIIQYSPYQVQEYGFKDGRVYISREISLGDTSGRVFLQRLSKGHINLYYYKSRGSGLYFLEKDSSVLVNFLKVDANARSFKEQLYDLTSECSSLKDVIRYAHYNNRSLEAIIDRYNDCELKPFPHFRYGLTAGYEMAKLNPGSRNSNEYINYIEYGYNGGFTAGLFIDSPIDFSCFSIHSELYFSMHGYYYFKNIENQDIDFIANFSSLKLPVLLRYTYPSKKVRPFINAGGMVTFKTLNENKILETTVSGNSVVINDTYASLPDRYQIGYSFGVGIESCLTTRRSLFLEVRYNKQYDKAGIMHESYINFMTGINF
jgi:hypothetical protein